MKKMIKLLVIAITISQFSIAQDYEIGEKPDPIGKKTFEFPSHKEATLDNGLRLFIIEDHEQPMMSFNILMPGGDALEAKKDAAGFTAALMMKGTKNRTAYDISNTLDGVGAGISISNSTEYSSISGSSIMKHKDLLFDVLLDVITNPVFPEEELKKMKVQAKAGIKSAKSDPGSLASNMAKKALFGPNHPYASVSTEKSIDAIQIADLKKYYEDFYIPNSATMVIVGDFDTEDIIEELNEKFATWEKGKLVSLNIPEPDPMPRGIYFIERPGSVQSAVRYANMTVPFNSSEYLPINVGAHLLNSSFAGRMFKIIREKHSYTYSPTGGHSSNRFYNYSIFGSDVRNDVTDSTIISINNEILGDLMQNGPTEEELSTIKQFRIGQYYLSFESAGFLGSQIQKYDFRDVPIRMIKEYPNNYGKVTAKDAQKAIQRYLNPDEGYIVVVGDPSVKKQLEQFGPVYTYNTDYEPASKLEKISMDADELLEKYTDAIGGEDAINNVKVLEGRGDMVMTSSGQKLPGKSHAIYDSKGKFYRLVDLNIFKSVELYNGKDGWEIQNTDKVKLEGEKLKSIQFEADPFHYANALKFGYKVEVVGIQDNMVVAKLMDGGELLETLYFNQETYLLEKTEDIQTTNRGKMLVTVKYTNYKDVEGIKLPTSIVTETPMFGMETNYDYTVNKTTYEDSKFEPTKK